MLSFTGSLKVFVALDPIDMRKGFEGLYAAVSEKLKADVRSGALFAFTQQEAHTFEGHLLGQDRAVADDEASGEGDALLAAQRGATSHTHQPGTGCVCDAHRRHRHA